MLTTAQQLLLFFVTLSWALVTVSGVATWYLLRRRRALAPSRWPSVSILKPLAGLEDEELLENLESHLRLDYPGEVEVLLGVRSEADAAWPLARDFAARHAGRVRLLVQEGEPGLNPKVNQLITLTRHARGELLCVTDSNVRVPAHYLREHVALLQGGPRVGLTSNAFVGVGEASVGGAFDNLTQASHTLPGLAAADVLLRVSQIISKSLVMTRDALAAVGGWEAFKDVLAEDQRLGRALEQAGYRTVLCPTPVRCAYQRKSLNHFWARHSRWSMIRHTLLRPAVYLEPLLNPTVMGLLVVLAAPTKPWAWAVAIASALVSTLFTQAMVRLAREPMALRWALLTPARDVVHFGAWLVGAFQDTVTWRGNVLAVGAGTHLSRRGAAGPLPTLAPSSSATR